MSMSKCVNCGKEFDNAKRFDSILDEELCHSCEWDLTEDVLGDINYMRQEIIRRYKTSNAKTLEYMDWAVKTVKHFSKEEENNVKA